MVAIRGTLAELYGDGAASETPLLYGGSVTPDNVAGICKPAQHQRRAGGRRKPERRALC